MLEIRVSQIVSARVLIYTLQRVHGKGWVLWAKPLTGMSTSHIRVTGSSPGYLCFQPSFLSMHLGGSR